MRLTLAFILCLAITSLSAQTLILTDPIQVADEEIYGKTRPRIDVNRSGDPVVMWGNNATKEVYVSVLLSGTTSFSSPTLINPNGVDAMIANWAGPDIASYGDTVFVAYHSLPDNHGYCYVHKSVDGGLTFTDSVRVDDASVNQSRIPSISVTPEGNPVVGFMKFEGNYIDPQYTVANSSDGGLSFFLDVEASQTAPGEVCDCCQAQVAAGNGRQAIVYRNNDDNLRDNWVSISNDEGVSFPITVDVDESDWVVSACPASGPDAFFAGDTLYTTWMSEGNGDTRTYVASVSAENGAIGFSGIANTLPFDGTTENYARIDGDGQNVGLVYQGWKLGNYDCLLLASTSGIEGFGDPISLGTTTDGAQRYPDIVHHNGEYHIVYDDSEAGHLMYQRAFFGNVGLTESSPIILKAWSPDTGILRVKIKGNSETHELTVSNELGQTIHNDRFQGSDFIMSGLRSGLCFVQVISGTSSRSMAVLIR